MLKVGVIVFEQVEEMDFIGPFEVLSYANKIGEKCMDIRLISHSNNPVTAFNGLRFLPDQTISEASKEQFDVLIVPGGKGRYIAMKEPEILSFLAAQAPGAKLITSVCTGAFILAESGLLDGKKATIYHTALPELRAYAKIEGVAQKVVKDGKIITAAGVTSGIELGFFLLQNLFGQTMAELVANGIEYTVNWEALVPQV